MRYDNEGQLTREARRVLEGLIDPRRILIAMNRELDKEPGAPAKICLWSTRLQRHKVEQFLETAQFVTTPPGSNGGNGTPTKPGKGRAKEAAKTIDISATDFVPEKAVDVPLRETPSVPLS